MTESNVTRPRVRDACGDSVGLARGRVLLALPPYRPGRNLRRELQGGEQWKKFTVESDLRSPTSPSPTGRFSPHTLHADTCAISHAPLRPTKETMRECESVHH